MEITVSKIHFNDFAAKWIFKDVPLQYIIYLGEVLKEKSEKINPYNLIRVIPAKEK